MAKSDIFESIEHPGIVQETNEKTVTVKISSESACSGCQAAGACTLSGNEQKLIEITGIYDVRPGDQVTVIMKKSMGYAAVMLAYVLPFFAVLAVLIVLISISVQEAAAGLISLLTLVLYYIILYFFRNRISNKFTFTLKS